jgi:hypothetical protein
MFIYVLEKEVPLGLFRSEQLACSEKLNMRKFLRESEQKVGVLEKYAHVLKIRRI